MKNLTSEFIGNPSVILPMSRKIESEDKSVLKGSEEWLMGLLKDIGERFYERYGEKMEKALEEQSFQAHYHLIEAMIVQLTACLDRDHELFKLGSTLKEVCFTILEPANEVDSYIT